MTKTAAVRFGDANMWVYDVAGGIFLKHLIDAAAAQPQRPDWLNDAIRSWRVAAAVTELAGYANDEWTPDQVDRVVHLCREAIVAIEQNQTFASAEVESWPLIGDQRIFCRGHDNIPAEPITSFGRAFVALLTGNLPIAPDRHWWFFTLDDEPQLIAMRTNDR